MGALARGIGLAACLAAVAACRHSPPQSPTRAEASPGPQPTVAARPALPRADAGVANLDRIQRTAALASVGSQHRAGPGLPLLPGAPGVTRSEASGCLAAAAHDESAGRRFPAPAPTRGQADSRPSITPMGNGIVIVHELGHACCLRSRVEGQVEGQSVRVVETLEGKPCRCMCQSTLRTVVGLAPGQYQVVVTVVEPGRRRDVLQASVEIKRLRD